MQRVITALYGVTKKLDQWYARQLADLDLTQGEWAVVAVARQGGGGLPDPEPARRAHQRRARRR